VKGSWRQPAVFEYPPLCTDKDGLAVLETGATPPPESRCVDRLRSNGGLYAQTLENSVKVDFRLPQSGAALVCLYRFYFHGHYTFCGRSTPIDLDAVLANLALEEGDERLPQTSNPQIMDSIRLDPEMLWQTA